MPVHFTVELSVQCMQTWQVGRAEERGNTCMKEPPQQAQNYWKSVSATWDSFEHKI